MPIQRTCSGLKCKVFKMIWHSCVAVILDIFNKLHDSFVHAYHVHFTWFEKNSALHRSRNGRGGVVIVQFSNMLLQIKVSTEAFPTGYTSKRLLIVVSMHMKSQIINLMKGFVANCTFILLFAAVRQFVILVVSWKEMTRKKVSKKIFLPPRRPRVYN